MASPSSNITCDMILSGRFCMPFFPNFSHIIVLGLSAFLFLSLPSAVQATEQTPIENSLALLQKIATSYGYQASYERHNETAKSVDLKKFSLKIRPEKSDGDITFWEWRTPNLGLTVTDTETGGVRLSLAGLHDIMTSNPTGVLPKNTVKADPKRLNIDHFQLNILKGSLETNLAALIRKSDLVQPDSLRFDLSDVSLLRQATHLSDLSHFLAEIDLPPFPNTQNQADLTLETANMHFSATDIFLAKANIPSLGKTIQSLQMRLDLTHFFKLFSPDFSLNNPQAWQNNQGSMAFEEIKLKWDQLNLNATGEAGLDPSLEARGQWQTKWQGVHNLLDNLAKEGHIDVNTQSALTFFMALFSQDDPKTGERIVNAPVSIRQQGLFLGPVRVSSFPALNLQK